MTMPRGAPRGMFDFLKSRDQKTPTKRRERTKKGTPKYIQALPFFEQMCYDIRATTPKTGRGKGVLVLNLAISFLFSVAASVVAYYICKWLDGE